MLELAQERRPDDRCRPAQARARRLGSIVLRVAREPPGCPPAPRSPSTGRASRRCSPGPSRRTRSSTSRAARPPSCPTGRVIIATGPLTSPAFEPALRGSSAMHRLAFYDAAAPIVDAETIDTDVVFAASRYGKGEGADYLNAPMTREEYERFHDALVAARARAREGVRAQGAVLGLPAGRGGRAHRAPTRCGSARSSRSVSPIRGPASGRGRSCSCVPRTPREPRTTSSASRRTSPSPNRTRLSR